MIRVVVIFCLLAVSQSSPFLKKPTLQGRIVGGQKIDIEKKPFQVSLEKRGIKHCGGSLIGNGIVLTAAHCLERTKMSSLSVRIGSSFHKSGGRTFNLSDMIIHPKYKPLTHNYDFSILILKNFNTEGLIFGYAELPKAGQDVADETPLTVSGWGITKKSNESNAQLRVVEVLKVNQDKCAKAYAGVTDAMLCAGIEEGGKDACQGDSGSPLMNGRVQVGVVSWGEGCGLRGFPGVYARVAAARDWIKSVSGV